MCFEDSGAQVYAPGGIMLGNSIVYIAIKLDINLKVCMILKVRCCDVSGLKFVVLEHSKRFNACVGIP